MVEILYEIRNDIRFESNFYRGNCRVLTRAVLDILKDKFKCEPWLVKVISGYDHTFPVIDLNGDKIIVDYLQNTVSVNKPTGKYQRREGGIK
jgi:hypothetical protein